MSVKEMDCLKAGTCQSHISPQLGGPPGASNLYLPVPWLPMWSALKFHICVCVCLCLYVCVYLCVCICAYPCVYVYVCVHVCVYLCGGQGLLFHQWSACPGLPSHPLVSLQSHEGGSVGAPLSLHRSRDGITVPSVVFAQSKDIICDF